MPAHILRNKPLHAQPAAPELSAQKMAPRHVRSVPRACMEMLHIKRHVKIVKLANTHPKNKPPCALPATPEASAREPARPRAQLVLQDNTLQTLPRPCASFALRASRLLSQGPLTNRCARSLQATGRPFFREGLPGRKCGPQSSPAAASWRCTLLRRAAAGALRANKITPPW